MGDVGQRVREGKGQVSGESGRGGERKKDKHGQGQVKKQEDGWLREMQGMGRGWEGKAGGWAR